MFASSSCLVLEVSHCVIIIYCPNGLLLFGIFSLEWSLQEEIISVCVGDSHAIMHLIQQVPQVCLTVTSEVWGFLAVV